MIECSNCGRFTSPNEDYCEYCHEKITQEAIEKYEERKKDIVEIEQKNTEFLDTKSKNIVDFFSIFNIILIVINVIGAISFFFITGELFGGYIEFPLSMRLIILVLSLGYTLFLYMAVEMGVKHFSNVAEIKEMKFQSLIHDENEQSSK